MAKTVHVRKLSGPMKRRRTKKDSRDRVARRNVEQVTVRLTSVAGMLVSTTICTKFPCFRASDVLTLCLFCESLLKQKWSLDCVAVSFIVAHAVRDPKLLAKLCQMARKNTTVPSEAVTWLRSTLQQRPFCSQHMGYPFWIGNASFHHGVATASKWLKGDCELKFFNASLQLVRYARNLSSAQETTAALQLLPGKDAYAYHALRSWDAVVRFVKASGLLPLPRLAPTSHEYEASHMTEHVRVLYNLINWSHIKYPEDVPLQGIKKKNSVREGDRALLCCELQEVLASQKIVLTQQEVRDPELSKSKYVQSVDKDRLLTLEHELQNASEPPDAPVKKASACRKEGEVLNQHFRRAKSFAHSSLTSRNKIAEMLKMSTEQKSETKSK